MDLNALRLFVDIVDAGNLSAAARKLKMTRANVSYRLKALEEELGVQLLRRTTRHVEPTPVAPASTSTAATSWARWPPPTR